MWGGGGVQGVRSSVKVPEENCSLQLVICHQIMPLQFLFQRDHDVAAWRKYWIDF